MATKAFINYPVFTQTTLDSGALTMLGVVIHNFPEPGEYRGTASRGERDVADFYLRVDKESDVMQVDIDLATLDRPATELCECKSGLHERERHFVVNPKGYAVFYVSRGTGGYAVRVGRVEERSQTVVFDSREMKGGDLFAATLIRPGTYSVTNLSTGAKGEIVVSYPPQVGKERYRPPEPVEIECAGRELRPEKIKIQPAQGQIYRCQAPSRIRIELVKPDDGPRQPRQPVKVAGWRKPPTKK